MCRKREHARQAQERADQAAVRRVGSVQPSHPAEGAVARFTELVSKHLTATVRAVCRDASLRDRILDLLVDRIADKCSPYREASLAQLPQFRGCA